MASCKLFNKNATILTKNDDGIQERGCLRILEKTYDKAFGISCKDNPNDKKKQQTFEQLQPKNVRLRTAAKRMVCSCKIHKYKLPETSSNTILQY